jgi:uridine kinase
VSDCFFVGVCGGSASGKTSLSQKLYESYKGRATTITQDDYYHDSGHLSAHERAIKNYDHPSAIDLDLLCTGLQRLKSGCSVEVPTYCFDSHGRLPSGKTVVPNEIIIVEGLFVFERPELRDLLDLKIFLHVDQDLRLIRRIRRDVEERGRTLSSVLDQYVATTKPMHEQFVEPVSQYADMVFSSSDEQHLGLAVQRIVEQITISSAMEKK